MWTAGQKYCVTGKGFNPEDGTIKRADGDQDGTQDAAVRSSLFAALLCCNTTIKKTADDSGNAIWEPHGNSSEAPIVVAAQKIGFKGEEVAKDFERVVEVPFSSARKMMLTVSKMKDNSLGSGGIVIDGRPKLVAVCKGAPNFVLSSCVSWLNADGVFEPLQEEKRAELLRTVDEFSSQALRVLAIGVNFMSDLPYDTNDEDVTIDTKFTSCRGPLRFLGLVASIDPERTGVPEAVQTARGASIRVVMITGDYLKTAIAIGHNCNILQDGDNDNEDAVDCGILRPGGKYLSNNELDQITSHVKVFARAQPEDKLEIVKSLQRQEHVAAMTGDGVNDAPALNCADIGVAMGIQGTEVAKGAAAMVLTDDNFANIVVAVEKGRVIYSGIQKFVAFIMSVHIAEVIQIFTCVVASLPIMRSPLQILFLILVTDLPPSIALGVEPGEKGILKQRPRPKKEPIVLSWMWQSICVNGAILAAVIIAIYVFALHHYLDGAIHNDDISALREAMGADYVDENLAKARTVAFISLVFSENVRAYISRSFNRPVWSQLCANITMLYAVVLAQMALYIAVLVPYFSETILELNGRDIGVWGWGVASLGPLGCLVLCECYKVVTHFQMKNYQSRLEAQQLKMEEQRKQLHDTQVIEPMALPSLIKQPSDPKIAESEVVAKRRTVDV
jgi:magnesium-transporting ATPase (P-type)